jgi:hypothetical protein
MIEYMFFISKEQLPTHLQKILTEVESQGAQPSRIIDWGAEEGHFVEIILGEDEELKLVVDPNEDPDELGVSVRRQLDVLARDVISQKNSSLSKLGRA